MSSSSYPSRCSSRLSSILGSLSNPVTDAEIQGISESSPKRQKLTQDNQKRRNSAPAKETSDKNSGDAHSGQKRQHDGSTVAKPMTAKDRFKPVPVELREGPMRQDELKFYNCTELPNELADPTAPEIRPEDYLPRKDRKRLSKDFKRIALPTSNDAWGIIPWAIPCDHPDSPPARSSNAETKVQLWENRKSRFQVGDPQPEKLVVPLIDMRPDPETGLPNRKPTFWTWGEPKDWNDKRTIKIINDRRREAIARITCEAPWTNRERAYLVELLQEKPNISITELAERFNFLFAGNFATNTALATDCDSEINIGKAAQLRDGRILESVRAEYLAHKEDYDSGKVPAIKETKEKASKSKTRKINPVEHVGSYGSGSDDGGDALKHEKVKAVETKQTKVKETKTKAHKTAKPVPANNGRFFTVQEQIIFRDLVVAKPNIKTQELRQQFNAQCKERDVADGLPPRKVRTNALIAEHFTLFGQFYQAGQLIPADQYAIILNGSAA